jgi:Protein of unknown function (DUF5132)
MTTMAGFEDIFEGGNIGTGLAVVVGAAVLGPLVAPIVRPVAKAVIKAGLVVYDQGRQAYAEVSERTGDLVAEARSEMEAETPKPAPARAKTT